MNHSEETWVAWIIEADCTPSDYASINELASDMSEYFFKREEQTTHFEWSINTDHDKMILHERYVSSEAALQHIQAFGSNFASRFSSMLQPKRVLVMGHPSKDLLNTLSGMNPEVATSFAGFSR